MADNADPMTVQLQVNNTGAWKTVSRFTWVEFELYYSRTGVERIALADRQASRWRIATCDPVPRVLQRFSVESGWQEPTL